MPGAMKRNCQFVLWGLLMALMAAATGLQSAAQSSEPGGAQGGNGAAASDPAPMEQTPGIRIRSNLVVSPVTVTDSTGEFVYDLSEADFRIFDDGAPMKIENFAQESRPLAVVILVQTSESVAPLLAQLEPVAPVISNLLLGPAGQASVVTYADQSNVAQDFSDSPSALAQTFKNFSAEGRKARLNDALARSIAMLARRPKSERRIIVVFSDGFDSGSETSKEDVMQRATGADVTIYGLDFSRAQALIKSRPADNGPSPLDQQVTRPVGPGTVATPTNADNTYGNHGDMSGLLGALGSAIHHKVGTSELEFYSETSGGMNYSHWKESTLQDHITEMATEVHSQYELAYVPPSNSKPGFHRIEVRVMHRGMKVRTRSGYFYAGR